MCRILYNLSFSSLVNEEARTGPPLWREWTVWRRFPTKMAPVHSFHIFCLICFFFACLQLRLEFDIFYSTIRSIFNTLPNHTSLFFLSYPSKSCHSSFPHSSNVFCFAFFCLSSSRFNFISHFFCCLEERQLLIILSFWHQKCITILFLQFFV